MKLEVPKQASKVEWWESLKKPGHFTVRIDALDDESAGNIRRYLPLVERILLGEWDGKKVAKGGEQ